MTPHFNPDIFSAARSRDDETLRRAVGGVYLLLDCSEFVERLPLPGGQDLPEHAHDGFPGQRTGRQFDLTPGQGTTKFVNGGRIQDNVRLLADVHDERFAIQTDNRVEK